MKNFLNLRRTLSLVVLITIFQGCYIDPFREFVYGEGPVIKKIIDNEPFTGTRVSSGIDVFVRQDENLGVTVEVDEIRVSLSSAGDIRLSGQANFLDAHLSSAGRVKSL